VPENTTDLLERICPDGHPFITLREELGSIFTDEQFAHLYRHEGRPVVSPATLALVCILQYMEGLTDRQTVQAVQMRVDWKYLLGLDLDDRGFDHTVLGDFRQRLVDKQAEHLLFDLLLQACKQRGLLTAGGKQRSDSTHVLAAIRTLERWSRSARRCAPRSITLPAKTRPGFAPTCLRSGLTSMASASTGSACPKNRRNVLRWP
jgi:transposase